MFVMWFNIVMSFDCVFDDFMFVVHMCCYLYICVVLRVLCFYIIIVVCWCSVFPIVFVLPNVSD